MRSQLVGDGLSREQSLLHWERPSPTRSRSHKCRTTLERPITADAVWPALPLAQWLDTCTTLHMWTQIVGKTRLALAPSENHWWQVPLYVSPRGLTTSSIPFRDGAFVAEFDFLKHALVVRKSNGATRTLALTPRSVADFYAEYMALLKELDINVRMRPVPAEVEVAIPFPEDRTHASYDSAAVTRFFHILLQVDRLLKRFRSRFLGKASPVHFFWGGFDMAQTRFNGRPAPRHPGGIPNTPDWVMYEAYSHECSSCGFWPGSGTILEPAFYAYGYPEPKGYSAHPVRPAPARYDPQMRLLILPYDAVRESESPDEMVLDFFQSAYETAADLGGWDRTALDRPRALWS